jgi:uncharacterized phiE125 gp8 family phage protein
MAHYIHPQIITIPELISLAEAKLQLKLDNSWQAEDSLLEMYIGAAINEAENYTATAINKASFLIKTSAFSNSYAIPLSPVQTINSIKYYNTAGTLTVLDAAKYELRPLDKYQSEIYFKDFANIPAVQTNNASAVIFEVTTGYESATLPMAIKQAIMIMISSFYENRTDSVEVLPKASTNLLSKYRFHY